MEKFFELKTSLVTYQTTCLDLNELFYTKLAQFEKFVNQLHPNEIKIHSFDI